MNHVAGTSLLGEKIEMGEPCAVQIYVVGNFLRLHSACVGMFINVFFFGKYVNVFSLTFGVAISRKKASTKPHYKNFSLIC